jgi:hypothetical protein
MPQKLLSGSSNKRTPARMATFLRIYAECGRVAEAAKAAGARHHPIVAGTHDAPLVRSLTRREIKHQLPFRSRDGFWS